MHVYVSVLLCMLKFMFARILSARICVKETRFSVSVELCTTSQKSAVQETITEETYAPTAFVSGAKNAVEIQHSPRAAVNIFYTGLLTDTK